MTRSSVFIKNLLLQRNIDFLPIYTQAKVIRVIQGVTPSFRAV